MKKRIPELTLLLKYYAEFDSISNTIYLLTSVICYEERLELPYYHQLVYRLDKLSDLIEINRFKLLQIDEKRTY